MNFLARHAIPTLWLLARNCLHLPLELPFACRVAALSPSLQEPSAAGRWEVRGIHRTSCWGCQPPPHLKPTASHQKDLGLHEATVKAADWLLTGPWAENIWNWVDFNTLRKKILWWATFLSFLQVHSKAPDFPILTVGPLLSGYQPKPHNSTQHITTTCYWQPERDLKAHTLFRMNLAKPGLGSWGHAVLPALCKSVPAPPCAASLHGSWPWRVWQHLYQQWGSAAQTGGTVQLLLLHQLDCASSSCTLISKQIKTK